MGQDLGKRQVFVQVQFRELVDGLAAPLDDGLDAVLVQPGAQRIALVRLDLVILVDVEMVRVGVRTRWQHQVLQTAQALVIECGEFAPARDRAVVTGQLVIEHGGLQVVQARVVTPGDDVAGVRATMVTQQA